MHDICECKVSNKILVDILFTPNTVREGICAFLQSDWGNIMAKIQEADPRLVSVAFSKGNSAIFVHYEDIGDRRIARMRVAKSENNFGDLNDYHPNLNDFDSEAFFLNALIVNEEWILDIIGDEQDKFRSMLRAVADRASPAWLEYCFCKIRDEYYVKIGTGKESYVLLPLPTEVAFDVSKTTIEGASQ
jgi:hypothetical protein